MQYLDTDIIHPDHLVFAVEASIDFWQPLVDYLYRQNYSVIIVSPLTTKKSRALPGHDFFRTDPPIGTPLEQGCPPGCRKRFPGTLSSLCGLFGPNQSHEDTEPDMQQTPQRSFQNPTALTLDD